LCRVATRYAYFIYDADEKGDHVNFYIKLTQIALALITATRIRRLVFAGRDDAAVDRAVPPKARSLAVASLLLWAGAITAGRLMAYLKLAGLQVRPRGSICFSALYAGFVSIRLLTCFGARMPGCRR